MYITFDFVHDISCIDKKNSSLAGIVCKTVASYTAGNPWNREQVKGLEIHGTKKTTIKAKWPSGDISKRTTK